MGEPITGIFFKEGSFFLGLQVIFFRKFEPFLLNLSIVGSFDLLFVSEVGEVGEVVYVSLWLCFE
jgi:hypothetical protein